MAKTGYVSDTQLRMLAETGHITFEVDEDQPPGERLRVWHQPYELEDKGEWADHGVLDPYLSWEEADQIVWDTVASQVDEP